MTRIRFDQLAKQYLEEFLEPLGTVQRNLEVPGESTFVDVWFNPTTTVIEPSSDLGLLSRIATTPCLLEPFRNAPTRQEVRSCLLKLFWLQADQRRRTEQDGRTQTENDLPRLWLLAATATKPVIAEFGGQIRADWGAGVYFLPEAHKTTIVAIDELPPTPETLWLRILGRDRTQQQAIAELLELSTSDRRRSRVLQLLVNWRIKLELSSELEQEEQSLMVALSQAYLEWEQRTKQQGAEEAERSLILRQLNRRVGALSETARSQIDTLSLNQLEALGEALLDFRTIADLDGWLQANQ
jgi:hypothetical protein